MRKFVAPALALPAIPLPATDAQAFGRKGRCGGIRQSCQPAQGNTVTGCCQGNTVVTGQTVTQTVSYNQYAPVTSAPVQSTIISGCSGNNCQPLTIFRR